MYDKLSNTGKLSNVKEVEYLAFLRQLLKNKSSISICVKNSDNIIVLFSYFSWFVTSLFFLSNQPFEPAILKIGIVILLLFANIIITTILLPNKNKSLSLIISLVIVESIGISLLLIPTGGIKSPFIWYALNPILLATNYLYGLFAWLALFLFMTSSTFITFRFFNETNSFFSILSDNSYLYLVLILTTFSFQLFSTLTKKLNLQTYKLKNSQDELLIANKELRKLNKLSKVRLEHIMSLYQAIETFNAQNKPNELIKIVNEYVLKLSSSHSAFFWLFEPNTGNSYISVLGKTKLTEEDINHFFKKRMNNSSYNPIFTNETEVNIQKNSYFISQIHTSNQIGILGMENNNIEYFDSIIPAKNQLSFLAKLSTVILERLNLEQLSDQLLITEEQNRIANEIHDSVSQRLFGIVYSIHNLSKTWKTLDENRITTELNIISASANTTLKELRFSIYRLSSLENGQNVLSNKIKYFLNDIARLYHIKINYDLTGKELFLTHEQKKVIYHLITEICGNSARHGKANYISIKLNIDKSKIELNITDNGIGFDLNKVVNEGNNGIGLTNIHKSVQSFGGTIIINSDQNQGTEIKINLPNIKKQVNQEVKVYEISYSR